MIQSYTRLIHGIAQNNTIANANTNIPNKLIHVWPLSAGMNFPIKRYSDGAAKVEPAYTMIALVPTCENHRFLELITLISATIINPIGKAYRMIGKPHISKLIRQKHSRNNGQQ